MNAQSYYLLILILTTLVILAGLAIVIIGIVKKKVKLIALGVFVALLPSLVTYFSTKLL